MTRVVVLGDSIAFGFEDSEGGWVDRLKRYMYETQHNVSVSNLGVSGDSTREVLARAAIELAARKPDIIVYAVGINDTQQHSSTKDFRVSEEEFLSNLSKLLTIARTHTEKVLFLGLTPVDDTRTMPLPWHSVALNMDAASERYDALLQSFCAEHGASYLECRQWLLATDFPDGLHPGPDGHALLSEKVKEEIQRWLS